MTKEEWVVRGLWLYVLATLELLRAVGLVFLLFLSLPVALLFPVHTSMWIREKREASNERFEALMARAEKLKQECANLR